MCSYIDVKPHRETEWLPVDVKLHRFMASTLRERWKLARERAGLGYNELDRLIGQGSGYTSPLEAGTKENPKIDIVAKAAEVLKVSAAWLAFGEGPMERDAGTTIGGMPVGTLFMKMRKQSGLENWLESNPGAVTVSDLVRGIHAIESGRAAAYARVGDQRPHAGWGAFFRDLQKGKFDESAARVLPGGAQKARAKEIDDLGGDAPSKVVIPPSRSKAPAVGRKSPR